jgi:hypothetical protein
MGPSLLLAEGYKKIPCPPERATGEYLFSDMLSAGRAAHNQSGGAGRSQMCRAVGEESACGFERSKAVVWCQTTGLKRPEWLPPQFQRRSIVPFLVALPHRPFSFPEPSAELVPLAIGISQSVSLPAPWAFHGLLVRKRVADCGLAVHDFFQGDSHGVRGFHRKIRTCLVGAFLCDQSESGVELREG